MNFRINESDSSLPSILLYLALLSLVGGSLGMYAKKRLNHASQHAELAHDHAWTQQKIEVLRAKLKAETNTAAERKALSRALELEISQVEARLLEATRKCEALQAEQEEIRRSIHEAKDACADQLTRYRVITWKAAEGEVHPEIKTLNGKIYRHATIKRVTAEGVEITHEGGPGRLSPGVLDRKWHDRFQWKNPLP